MTIASLLKRLDRIEAKRHVGAPSKVLAFRPLEDGEAAAAVRDWPEWVADGRACLWQLPRHPSTDPHGAGVVRFSRSEGEDALSRDLERRLARIEVKRGTPLAEPTSIFSNRPLEADPAVILRDWRAWVASGRARLVGQSLHIMHPRLTREQWLAMREERRRIHSTAILPAASSARMARRLTCTFKAS